MYFEVTVIQKLVIEGPRGGTKEKKVRDYLLVEGESVTEVEAEVTKLYEHNPNDWEILSVKQSKIVELILDEEE